MSFADEAERQLTLELDPHGARKLLQQRLRREHVLDFGRTDPERQRAERSVGRGMTVTADDRHAGLRDTQLGTDHVHDSLAPASGRKQPYAELVAVRPQRIELLLRERIRDRTVECRHVVIHRRDGEVGPAHAPAGRAQRLERLRARHLVHEVEVDPQERRCVCPAVDDKVLVPDLPEERAAHCKRSAA